MRELQPFARKRAKGQVFGTKIALAKGKERINTKGGRKKGREFFSFKSNVVLLVVVLSTLDSFCQKKKKCLTEEEKKIRLDLFLYRK